MDALDSGDQELCEDDLCNLQDGCHQHFAKTRCYPEEVLVSVAQKPYVFYIFRVKSLLLISLHHRALSPLLLSRRVVSSLALASAHWPLACLFICLSYESPAPCIGTLQLVWFLSGLHRPSLVQREPFSSLFVRLFVR